LIDGKASMIKFLNLIASEPDIARIPDYGRFFKMGNFGSRIQVAQEMCGEFHQLKRR
jgi:5-methyltetrahydrofolate--homocysteine methyltransferase